MKKIRVLQFPISANNGVKQYAQINWEFIDKSRFSFDFALVRDLPAIKSELLATGAGVEELLASADSQRDRYVEEAAKMLRGKYDAVHLHTSFWKRFLIEEIAMECGIPKVIVHSHSAGVDITDEQTRRKAEATHRTLREQFGPSLATHFCACSQAAADWLFGDRIPKDQIVILKNAINLEKYLFHRSKREYIRKQLGLEDSFVVGCVGRMVSMKNHQFLFEVLAKIKHQIPQVKCLLAGEGPLEHTLRETAQRLHIENDILFLGQRHDIPDLLQAMDCFCFPSLFEGLGIVLIEAQASGLPCVVSPAIPDEAFVTPLAQALPLETGVWAQALCSIAREQPERQNMWEPLTAAGYNIRYQIKEVEKLYET